MAIISSEQWQKKNKKQIAQNVEQNMQGYTPSQEPNWNNYLARHEEERRQAATYDPSTGSTVRAVTAEHAASTYADSKKKYQSNITQRRTNSAIQLVTDWLDTTSKYLNSGRADEKTRLALSMQHGNITDYLKRWGKDIDPDTLQQINKAVEGLNAYLDPNTARQAFHNHTISAGELDRIMTGGSSLNSLAGNYMGNFDRYAKENPTQYVDNVNALQQSYNTQRAKEILNSDPTRTSEYERAAQLSQYINSGGSLDGLSESDKDKATALLEKWSKNKVNRDYNNLVDSQVNNTIDFSNEIGQSTPQGSNEIPIQQRTLAPLQASTNELAAAYNSTVLNRQREKVEDLVANDPGTALQYYAMYAHDMDKLGGSYRANDIASTATYNEAVTYGYLKATQGEEAAQKYWNALEGDLMQRSAEKDIDYVADALGGSKFAHGVANLATQLEANANTIVGSFASPLTYLPGLDSNRQFTSDMLQYQNAVKAQNAQEVAGDSKLARILWEGASSGIENVVEAAAAGKIADAIGLTAVDPSLIGREGTLAYDGLLAQEKAREDFISVFVTLGMSSGAAMTAVEEGKAKGYSADEAAIRGLISGAIEFMTEKVGMDGVFRAVGEGRGALLAILKSGLAEGSEELVGNNLDRLATAIADAVTKKDASEYQQKVREYISQGMSETEAMQKVMLDYVDEDVEAFASAFFSAGMSAGGMGALTGNDIRTRREINYITNDAETRQAFIESGLESDKNTEAYKIANEIQEKLDSGEKVSPAEYEALYYANTRAEMGVADTVTGRAEIDMAEIARNEESTKAKATAPYQQTVKTAEGLKQLKNTLGSEGQRLFDNAINEAIRNKADRAQAYREVTNVYNAGAGVTNTYTATHLTADTTQALYKAGIADRETYAAKEANNKLMKNVSAGVAETPALTQAIEDGRVSDKTRNALDSLGKKLGTRIEIYNSNAEYNGQYNPNDSTIRLYLDSTLLKSADTDTILRATAGHEITHRLQSLSSKHYELLVKTVADTMGSEFSNAVNKYKAKDSRLSNAQAQDEVIADFVGRKIFTDDAFVDRLVNNIATSDTTVAEKKSALQSLKDFFHKIASWIRGNKVTDVSIDRIREIENKIDSIIKAGVENLKNAETFDGIREQLQSVGANATEGAIVKDSVKSWDETDISKLKQMLKDAGFSAREINKWIKDVNGVAATVLADRTRLDYDADEFQSALKPNAEYFYTLDLSTLCKKRQLYQGTYNAIMHRLQNAALMPEDTISLRAMMAEMGYEVPCGICYEESRKKNEGKFAKRWLEGYGKKWKGYKNIQHNDPYIPTLNQVTTTDGREWLRKNHPEALESYLNYQKTRGSANPKVSMTHTDYRGDILRMTDNDIENVKHIGGLRIQSFSDFETVHVIDMMQAVMDMSARKLTAQAYTKVPAFADIFGGTGIKINLSLIGKVNENGVLEFDAKEGMNPDEAFRLRNKYSKNVGTILVGANDESILAAWADDRIDMVIPFHRSGWGKAEFEKLGLVGYKDFTKGQTERYMMGKKDMALSTASKALGLTGDQKLEGIYAEDYWDYNKSGKENAEAYLELCAEKHYRPVFYQFLHDNGDGTWSLQPDGSTDGYWKSLIDFKMYDNAGKGAAQQTVRPQFDMEAAQRTMAEFDGNPNTLPVAENVVDRFVKEYNANHKNVKNSVKDTEYINAVNNGDMETAQRMVDEAAKEAGYTIKAYHGTSEGGRFNIFDPKKLNNSKLSSHIGQGFYFTNSREGALEYTKNVDSNGRATAGSNPYLFEGYIKLRNPIEISTNSHNLTYSQIRNIVADGNKAWFFDRGIAQELQNKDINGETYTKTQILEMDKEQKIDLYAQYLARYGDQAALSNMVDAYTFDTQDLLLEAMKKYTGNDGIHWQMREGLDQFVVFDSSQFKDSAPVTYDDNGNVIPLSERFNESNPDIRYSTKDSEGKELTPAQQEFFKDSKVRDDNGNLKVMYHGTMRGGFTVFDSRYSDDRLSLFFTDDPEVARTYTHDFGTEEVNTFREGVSGRTLYPVYLNITNPMVIDAKGAYWSEIQNGETESYDVERQTIGDFAFARKADADAFDQTYGLSEMYRLRDEARENGEVEWQGDMADEDMINDAIQDLEWEAEKDYRGYFRNNAAQITAKEFFDNYTDYGWYDLESLQDTYDSNGLSLDEIREYSDNDYAVAVAQMKEAFEDQIADGELDDDFFDTFKFRVIPRSGEQTTKRDLHSTRWYAQQAKTNGNDGVIISNVIDRIYGTGTATVCIAFDSEQVKSVNNANPTTNPDIRFSRKGSPQIDYDTAIQLQETNKQLQAEVERLRTEFKRKPIDVKDFSSRITRTIRSYEGTVDAQEIIDSLLPEARKFVLNPNKENEAKLYGKIQDAAHKIITTALTRDEFSEAAQVREFLKGRRIKVSPKIKSDFGDWMKDYHQRYFGNIFFTNDKGTSVEDTYSELQGQFGEGLFPSYYTNPSDQLEHILEVYEAVDSYYNPYDGQTAEAIESLSMELVANVLDTKVKYTYADKMRDRIARLRAEKNQKYEDLKAHYREVAENARNRRDERETRRRLLNVAQRLERIKTTAANRALIESLIGDLDTISMGMTGQGFENLQNLSRWYDSIMEDPDFVRDPNIEEKIKRLNKKHINGITKNIGTYATLAEAKLAQKNYDGDGTTNIRKTPDGYILTAHEDVMSIEDVRDLLDVLLNVENEIQTSKHLIDVEDRRDTFEMAQQIIEDVRNSNGVGNGYSIDMLNKASEVVDRLIVQGTLSPERAIHRYTGYVENDPLYLATKNLSSGQRNMLDYQYRANKKFLKFTEDGKFMDEITGKKAKALKFKAKNIQGNEVEVAITPAMRISLYLHSLNAQNLKHIIAGGLTIPTWNDYVKGKLSEAYAGGTVIRLTPSEIRSITSQMTTKEMALAKEVYDYFNGMSQDAINAVSEKVKGYALARVSDYFPINTDSNFLRKDYGAMQNDGTVQGMGFLKERIEGAVNPVLLRDVNDVLMQSIQMTSKYVGLAIPVSNMNKLLKAQSGTWNEETNKWEVETSVQKELTNKWKKKATEYIDKMLSDVQNPQNTQTDFDKMFGKIRSNYAGAVLTLNLSVAMKQAASYPTAAAVVGWKPLAKAMTQFGSVDLDLIARYTPLQWYRTQGFSTQELGDIKSRGKLMANLPKALNWIQAVDLLTTRKLWKAAEIYVQENNKTLTPKSDAYYQAVADIYNQIIEETQPNYTTMQRPELLRSSSAFTQAITMFKTQPFQNFNVTFDAVNNYFAKWKADKNLNTEQSHAELKQAQKRLSWAVTSQVAQLFTFAAMTLLWNALRGKWKKYKDDEDNLTVNSVSAGLAKDMASSLFSEVPLGAEAWEFISSKLFGDTYYGFDSVSVSALNDMVDAFNKASKAIGEFKDGEKNLNSTRLALDSAAKSITKVFGVPYENVENLFNIGFMNIAERMAPAFGGNKYEGHMAYLRLTVDPNKYKSDYYDNLIAAYENDKEAYKGIYDEMVKMDAFGEEKVRDKMDSYLKEKYNLKIMPSKYEGVKPETLQKISEALVEADAKNENPEKRNESFDQNEIYNALMELALDKQTAEKVWANEYGGNTSLDEYIAAQEKKAEAQSQLEDALGKAGVTMDEYNDVLDKMGSKSQANVFAALQDTDLSLSEKRAVWDTFGWKKSYDDYKKVYKEPKKTEPVEEPEEPEETETRSDVGYTAVSSNVLAGYEYHNGVLTVTLNNGRTYSYNVSQETFDAFEAADSKGSFWNHYIK